MPEKLRTPEEVEESFEQLGEELGLDGRCVVHLNKTGAVFEEPETGHQHIFVFATDPD